MAAPLNVGIAGLGTVGASVVRLLERQREALAARCGRPIVVVAASARSRGKKRAVDLGKLRWVADPVALAGDREVDVFVELIGGEGDPARAAVAAALAAGKSVVTANKALLARHGLALAALAEKNHVALNFEAAVGGAIPIVKTLREGLAGNSPERVYGILNGTCNYILTRMEQEKLAFAECLKEAELIDMMILARELQLTALVEVHDMDNLLRVRPHVGFPERSYGLLGINNRDLRTMETDIAHTLRLVDLVEDPATLVSESGIRTHADLVRLRRQGVRIVLVGESLMREADPGVALARLLQREPV